MLGLIYFVSILGCLAGWYHQYKVLDIIKLNKTTAIVILLLSMIPGINTIIAAAFLVDYIMMVI